MTNCFCVLQPPLTINGICVVCYRPVVAEPLPDVVPEEWEEENDLVLV